MTTAPTKSAHLLSTARDLFEREGFHATGIDRILSEANVAKMTLYNNFGSKEQLIVAVLEQASSNMISRLQTTAELASNDPYEQILAVFDAFGDWYTDPDFCGCMFQAAVAEFPDPDSPPALAARAHHERLCATFETLCERAELRETKTLARQLALLASGANCVARQARMRTPADDARTIVELLLERNCRL
jgi:AcrR family transcriptional regulator